MSFNITNDILVSGIKFPNHEFFYELCFYKLYDCLKLVGRVKSLSNNVN